MAQVTAHGKVQGSVIELEKPVPGLDGRRVKVIVEEVPAEEVVLSTEEHAALWREWVERGPQGPIGDEDAGT
jgi:hypothetical protein